MIVNVIVQNPTAERLIGTKEVCHRLDNISRAQLHRMRTAGQFPHPIRLSANRVAWAESVVNNWIASKIAEAA